MNCSTIMVIILIGIILVTVIVLVTVLIIMIRIELWHRASKVGIESLGITASGFRTWDLGA